MMRLSNETSLQVYFATGSLGDSILVVSVGKDMGDLMDSSFSPSVHGREAASKIWHLLFMIRWPFDELPV